MSLVTYYRRALLLPVAVPLLAIPLVQYSALAGFVYLSLLFGGVGYLLFLPFAYWAIGSLNSSGAKIRFARLSPLIFVPFQLVGLELTIVMLDIEPTSTVTSTEFAAFRGAPFWMLFDIAFGYAYVGMAEGLRLTIKISD